MKLARPVALAAACALLLLVLAPAAPAAGADGKEIFLAQKCDMCHSVSSAGIEATTKSEKMKGPDLKGKVAEKGAEWTQKFITKQIDDNGKKHPKDVSKLTPEEMTALLDWLAAQK